MNKLVKKKTTKQPFKALINQSLLPFLKGLDAGLRLEIPSQKEE
jgi:hypothetical protein